ncbi:MAG: hypothetical protein ACQEQA_03510 [Bacillota bacterium]
MEPYPNKTHLIYTSIAVALTLILYALGIYISYADMGSVWTTVGSAIDIYILLAHPLVFFLFGRKLVKTASVGTFPVLLLVVMLLLPMISLTYIIIPSIANIFAVESSIDIIFLIFEGAAILTTLFFFFHYLHRYVKNTMEARDLYAIHHYLIGTLIYFYFVRLTIISTIQITNALETLQ